MLCIAAAAASMQAQTDGRPAFSLGADISGMTELEAHGVTVSNNQGQERELTTLMKELGLNATRLRVWVDPKGGFCSPQDVLGMARRSHHLGMGLMIDFHYSDWWADPGKQNPPAAWAGLDLEQTARALADHTRSTLQLLKDNGIDVQYIQIGNETTHGFLWPMGNLDENFGNYARLTRAGYEAAKEVYPEATVLVHLDDGYDLGLYERVFDGLRREGCPFDAIGMSVYPFWSKRDPAQPTSVTDITDNIKALHKRYGVPVLIVETGVLASKPDEGYDFMSRLINAAIDDTEGACPGVWYWAPEACGGYELGAFEQGRPTRIMDAYTEAAARLAAPAPAPADKQ